MSTADDLKAAQDAVAAAQANVAKLQKEMASSATSSGTPDSQSASQTTTVPTVPTPSQAPAAPASQVPTVIGAAQDKRGGYVVGYSNGTVKLVDVPDVSKDTPAEPWGNAPSGSYAHFFVSNNGDVYNFVTDNGSIQRVENPVMVNPPAK